MKDSENLMGRLDPRGRDRLLTLLTSGGDNRILPGADGRNRYFATVAPFSGLAYGSSTISSISTAALNHLEQCYRSWFEQPLSPDAYSEGLEGMRDRLRLAFDAKESSIVFAASGTDLEYVGLASMPAGSGAACAILLGRDEVGSGCIHSAAGRFFADQTPLGLGVAPGTPIDARHAANRLVDVPIRTVDGLPRESAAVAADIVAVADAAIAVGEYPLIHVVHGSKTGLTLPNIADCRAIAAHFGNRARIIVDACQLRISPAMVRAYLDLGAVVLGTGSKFASGAPFSGFAFVPQIVKQQAAPLSPGFAQLARQAEWPNDWPGREILPDESNAGLALRLAGALFEIDRFAAVADPDRAKLISGFQTQLAELAEHHHLALLPAGQSTSDAHCLAATLATLDLATGPNSLDFDGASRIHRHLATHTAMRVGQPVKARRLDNGQFAGTLRLSLSMPMMVEITQGSIDAQERLSSELAQIIGAIGALRNADASLRSAA